jgi:hypothetical protein
VSCSQNCPPLKPKRLAVHTGVNSPIKHHRAPTSQCKELHNARARNNSTSKQRTKTATATPAPLSIPPISDPDNIRINPFTARSPQFCQTHTIAAEYRPASLPPPSSTHFGLYFPFPLPQPCSPLPGDITPPCHSSHTTPQSVLAYFFEIDYQSHRIALRTLHFTSLTWPRGVR